MNPYAPTEHSDPWPGKIAEVGDSWIKVTDSVSFPAVCILTGEKVDDAAAICTTLKFARISDFQRKHCRVRYYLSVNARRRYLAVSVVATAIQTLAAGTLVAMVLFWQEKLFWCLIANGVVGVVVRLLRYDPIKVVDATEDSFTLAGFGTEFISRLSQHN